ncbi:hypothetical protein M0R45_004016 [Rubus argutus]|uniref:C3H1-type domain-containing protein n=1 Tax=Rubus argutus TaxID=59490 RepID=A0AAW1YH67_RUBAR
MRMNMKRSRKSISWAPGVNLCQVKLFSSLDCPMEVGMKYQDHFQAKTSSMLHSNSVESNGSPPGFEVGISVNQSKLQHFCIPRIQWRCPTKLIMSDDWCVAAGEESEEAKAQKLREMRVLEAVYPRFSAIPPSPSVSLDVERERYDHSLTPCVPINPIEEESQEDQEDLATVNTIVGSQPPGFPQGLLASGTANASESNPPGFEQAHIPGKLPNQSTNFAAVASTALTAIKKSTEMGSMIDTELLIKILNDPKMIQKLINVHAPQADPGIPSIHTLTAPSSKTCRISGLKRPAQSEPLPLLSSPQVDNVMLPRPNQAQPNTVPLSSFPVQEAGTVKDMNYFKNLIRQHGIEPKESQDSVSCNNGNNHNHMRDLKMSLNFNPAELKAKKSKPCMFFKSAKGCRNGVNCEYLHDTSLHWRTGSKLEAQSAKRSGTIMEAQSAKRMKLNGVSTEGGECFRSYL